MNSSIAGSSPPLTAAASSPRPSQSPEPKDRRKGKTVGVAKTEKPNVNTVPTPESSDDEGEEEVYNDELEDEGITAIEGTAASKTYAFDPRVYDLLLTCFVI